MARVISKALIAFVVIVGLLIIAALVITLREPNSASVPMPNPNGYDDLVKAGSMVKVPSWPGPNQPSRDEPAQVVATNIEALELARTGLGRACRVPLDYLDGIPVGGVVHVPVFEYLARAFLVEGKLAESESRPADAAQSYLAITRVGQEVMRGATAIGAMHGSSIEAQGLAPLERIAPTLNANQCKQVIVALDSADAKRETVDNIVHQEKIWGRKAYGWRYYMHPIVIAQQKHRAACITVQSDNTRKLMITLAARAFELEKGAKPKSINDLVPNYLKTVPKDAFTGKDMAYPP